MRKYKQKKVASSHKKNILTNIKKYKIKGSKKIKPITPIPAQRKNPRWQSAKNNKLNEPLFNNKYVNNLYNLTTSTALFIYVST